MKVKKSGSYEEVLHIFMKPIGTIAQPILKLMKIFSTKRNIPFSTSQPFETEIGLKAGSSKQLMFKSKLQTESELVEKLWTGSAKTFCRSAKIDFIYNSLLHMI